MENLIAQLEYNRCRKVFEDGLTKYTQSNCTCTLTDDGYRIYRPADLIHDSSTMHNMWGGLVLKPFTYNSNILVEGQSYCLMFDIEGQSSNNSQFYWSNNCSWGGGECGLGTDVTNISNNMNHGSNFKGKKRLHYAFKTGPIYKTCTASYSSFVAGNSYNVFRDFKWGYGYSDTGALGTDIYITNLRMYNISHLPIHKINKNGILDIGAIIEYGNNVGLSKYSEISGADFIEV